MKSTRTVSANRSYNILLEKNTLRTLPIILCVSSLLVSCTSTIISTGWSEKNLSEFIDCKGVRYSPSSVVYFNSNTRNFTESEVKTYRINVYDMSNKIATREMCPSIYINDLEQKFSNFVQNQCIYSLMDYSLLGDEFQFDISINECPKKLYQLSKYRREFEASVLDF